MFRIRLKNTVIDVAVPDGTSTENIGLSPVREAPIGDGNTNDPDTVTLSALSVQEVYGKGGPTNIAVENVNTIQFDKSTGFQVTDLGDGQVFVDLGSSFADIYVEGEETLEAEGEDALELVAGENIKISTTTQHSGSTSKAIKISTINPGIYIIDASDDSSDLPLFLDMLENAQNYRGAIVYLLDVGPTPRPDPFLWKDKFYFNEGAEWFESPLALGRVLDEL
jgi:hypothetical protein